MEMNLETLRARSRMRERILAAAVFASLSVVPDCPPAYGDVGVILNESLNSGLASKFIASGHSAVYLSRVCAASLIRVRLCEPGEQGSVISTYPNLGEDQAVQWNVVPLNIFLYGVEDVQNRPLFASSQVKQSLEDRYRKRSLSTFCDGPPCSTNEKANWRDMVGATFDRNVYIFAMGTTIQQDQDFIAKFNALPYSLHFNLFFRNCADFTRETVNIYFPHAIHRDLINDFGMTSPKAVARSLVRYARQHPDVQFRVFHFAQLPGTIKRSNSARDGTEHPVLIVAPHELPIFHVFYLLTGRFNPQREWEGHPNSQTTEIAYQVHEAESEEDGELMAQLKVEENGEHANVVGTSEEWVRYRKEFAAIVREHVGQKTIPPGYSFNRFFKQFDQTGRPILDEHGSLWMQVADGEGTRKVALDAGSILTLGSDSLLAFELLLASVSQTLKSPPHSRETMVEFRDNWALLKRAKTNINMVVQDHARFRN